MHESPDQDPDAVKPRGPNGGASGLEMPEANVLGLVSLFHSGLSGGHMLHLLQQPIGEGTTGAEVGAPDRPGEPLLHADQSQVLALQ
jgi:hypothetical protein